MKKYYKVECVRIKKPIWAERFVVGVKASNLNEIIQGITGEGEFYILEIWEEVLDKHGYTDHYALVFPNAPDRKEWAKLDSPKR